MKLKLTIPIKRTLNSWETKYALFPKIIKVNGVYFLIWLEYYKKYQWMSGDGSVQTSYSLGVVK